jgi:tetratricopeptide (TPR) repeat protein
LSLRVLNISTLCILASTLFAQKQVDSLIELAQHSPDTILQVDALNDASYALRNVNPDSALLLAAQSERLAQLANYPLGVADAKMRQAIAITSQGNYYQALQLFLEAKSTFETLGVRARIASITNNIGRIYNFIEDYDLALEHYQQAATLFAELKNDSREGSMLNNIGYIHKLRGNYDQSLKFLDASYKKQLGKPENMIFPVYNKGSVYMKLNEQDSAIKYLDWALELSEQLRNHYIQSLTLIDYGELHMKLNNLDKAEESLREAYSVAADAGMRGEQRDAAKQLSEVYELQSEYDKALMYHKIYKATNDSLFNRDLARRMAFQEAEYEFNQKQMKDEVERKKVEIEQARILSNAIWVRNTLIIGLVLMILICYLIYKNFTRKRKANEALRKLNQQIEAQAVELKRANLEITVMNNNLETIVNRRTQELKLRNQQLKEYLSSNSHIVRAPLARILGLVDLYEPGDSENLDFINESLHISAKELDDALRQINKQLSDGNDQVNQPSS